MVWTLYNASKEFNTTEETIIRGLRQLGIDTAGRGREYTTMQIIGALYGDLKFEKTRRERAEANIAEQEELKNAGVLIHRDQAAEHITKTFGTVREQLMAMPGLMAPQANPSDPVHAQKILSEWVEKCLRHCRESIPEKMPK